MSTIWRKYHNLGKYHSKERVGCLSELIQEIQPVNEEQWMIAYYEKGKSVTDLWEIAKQMSDECGETPQECFKALRDLIATTFDGIARERKIADYIRGLGNKVEHSSGDLDRKGVDLIVDDKFYIQVKPHFFFLGNNNLGLIRDRQKMINQAKTFGKRYFVVVYESNTDNFDPHPYRVEELLHADGFSRYNKFNF